MRFLSIIMFISSITIAQWFYLNHDGVNRSYYVSYPNNSIEPAALIINMHGYGGSALNQQAYSQMDGFAHPQNVAVVYPQGLNNSWNVFTYWDSNNHDDVDFISTMIDEIADNFNIDLDRVYACGMSNGGYMSYRLACDLSDKIAAFGSVTGNFVIGSNSLSDCQDQERDIPIMHLHGTSDAVVNYYPPTFDGSLTVEQSAEFWSNYNNLDLVSTFELNSNVEIYRHYSQSTPAEFVYYKVYGGGHDWFGSPWAVNWGFYTSQELIDFFLQYKLSDFTENQLIGDLNQDSIINIQDIVLIVGLVLNSDYNSSADLNSDNVVSILDIVQLLDIILNN